HAERNVAIQRFSYQIALDKKGIFATPLDVDQALSILKQTEALIPELEISLRQTTNQLCILLGIPPEELQAKLRPGTTAFPANGAAAVGLGASLWGAGPWSVINTELFLAGRTGNIPLAPPEVVVGIPADLLRRRPDVRAAERQAAAQSALIGVAEAGF